MNIDCNKYNIRAQVGQYNFCCSILAFFIMLFAFIIMLMLGYWQVQRGYYKKEFFVHINSNKYYTLKEINELDNINFRKLKVKTTCNNKQPILIDLQRYNKVLGYNVLLACAVGNNKTLLVNFGWVKNFNQITVPLGQVIQGRIKTMEHNPFVNQIHQKLSFPIVVQGYENAYLSKILNTKLLPFMLLVDENSNIGFKKKWEVTVMPANRHFFYAGQWFIFAIISTIIFIKLNLTKRNKQ